MSGAAGPPEPGLRHAKRAIEVRLVMKFDKREKGLKFDVNSEIIFCVR